MADDEDEKFLVPGCISSPQLWGWPLVLISVVLKLTKLWLFLCRVKSHQTSQKYINELIIIYCLVVATFRVYSDRPATVASA
jgi:hypothetical protein